VRRIASAFAALAMATAILVGVQAPAQAYPNGCYYLTHPVFPSFGKAVRCTGGTGTFRIVIRCHDGFNSGYWYTYGAWVRPGDYSMSACLSGPAGGFMVTYWTALRN
jgi:hypothetical protein